MMVDESRGPPRPRSGTDKYRPARTSTEGDLSSPLARRAAARDLRHVVLALQELANKRRLALCAGRIDMHSVVNSGFCFGNVRARSSNGTCSFWLSARVTSFVCSIPIVSAAEAKTRPALTGAVAIRSDYCRRLYRSPDGDALGRSASSRGLGMPAGIYDWSDQNRRIVASAKRHNSRSIHRDELLERNPSALAQQFLDTDCDFRPLMGAKRVTVGAWPAKRPR
jgi:hypothetical protein